MSTLFLNPNLTAEQAMELYKRKLEGMTSIAVKSIQDIKPTLSEWAKEDAEWDAKFPPANEHEAIVRRIDRGLRDFEYQNAMFGMSMTCLCMGIL